MALDAKQRDKRLLACNNQACQVCLVSTQDLYWVNLITHTNTLTCTGVKFPQVTVVLVGESFRFRMESTRGSCCVMLKPTDQRVRAQRKMLWKQQEIPQAYHA